jgi:tRNA threonylcarbamoyl adenosine modification protein (Sua5/YciO/YrdC/YwlC family)
MKTVELHVKNPNRRDLQAIADSMIKGDIIIFPTDTVFAIGCLLDNNKGVERILKITGKTDKKSRMSLICRNIKEAAQYLLPMPNHIFRTMKDYVPGPYTFILKADSKTIKNLGNKKDEIGIRIPDNEIIQTLVEMAGQPIICTSLNKGEGFFSSIEEISDNYKHDVDVLISTELEEQEVSTVFDCTEDDLVLVREGKGKV